MLNAVQDDKRNTDHPPRFRDCLGLPPPRYLSLPLPEGSDLDTQMVKMLREYKTGRHHQAFRRLAMTKKDIGLDPGQRLIYQLDRLNEANAPLLIFELLFFMTGNDVPFNEELGRYFDAISCFHPDDAVCQGAIYNLLIVLALRKPDLAMARQLCSESEACFALCGSDYLRGFIQLHLAFVLVSDSDLTGAMTATNRAAAFFGPIAEADGERAVVEITRLWIEVERDGRLPPLARLLALRDAFFSGAIWPEAFLILAALIVRSASIDDEANVLRHLSELESTLRIRGMTQLLPAMQLLRENHRQKPVGSRAVGRDHLGLSGDQLIMLLPDARMLLTNWGSEVDDVPLSLQRLQLARDLLVGQRLLQEGLFDLAAVRILAAVERVEAQGWGWLARREHDAILLFCKECLARRRYVSPARAIRDKLLSQTEGTGVARPDGFTNAEFGLLQRLAQPRGNKVLAREMGLTEAAVKFHLRNIYRKLGVHSRSDALSKAQASGWIVSGHAGS